MQPLVRLIAERNSQVKVLSPLTNFKLCAALVAQSFFVGCVRRRVGAFHFGLRV